MISDVGTATSGQGESVEKEDNSEAIWVAIDHAIDCHTCFCVSLQSAVGSWGLIVLKKIHTLA